MHRKVIIFLILIFTCITDPIFAEDKSKTETASILEGIPPSAREEFSEVWAYLMQGEESELTGNEPITDLCYFSASINFKGELYGVKKIPEKTKLPKKTRTHLVIADLRNADLIHFAISKEFPMRKKLIEDIAAASDGYDGIQIDFEAVSPSDKNEFFEFLRDLKKSLGKKILSIALPARKKEYDDSFNYRIISTIVDRVFVMAYDQHWSGSEPGPIASPEWCVDVATFIKGSVPAGKLVMGIPFYGRSWQNKKHERAYRYSTVKNILKECGTNARVKDSSYPSFEYEDTVKVTVFFENIESLMKKAALYNSIGVKRIGFWRIGQGPKLLWNYLSIKSPETVNDR